MGLPNMTTAREGCAAVSVGRKIYVFGGHDGRTELSSAEFYNTTSQQWTKLPDMKQQRWECAATLVGNSIVIVGGHNGSNILSSCEVFDTFTDTWSSPIPDMKEKRWGCQAVSIGLKIYVMGGRNGSTTFSSVEVLEMSLSALYQTTDIWVEFDLNLFKQTKENPSNYTSSRKTKRFYRRLFVKSTNNQAN